jgi:hypothetical protein
MPENRSPFLLFRSGFAVQRRAHGNVAAVSGLAVRRIHARCGGRGGRGSGGGRRHGDLCGLFVRSSGAFGGRGLVERRAHGYVAAVARLAVRRVQLATAGSGRVGSSLALRFGGKGDGTRLARQSRGLRGDFGCKRIACRRSGGVGLVGRIIFAGRSDQNEQEGDVQAIYFHCRKCWRVKGRKGSNSSAIASIYPILSHIKQNIE